MLFKDAAKGILGGYIPLFIALSSGLIFQVLLLRYFPKEIVGEYFMLLSALYLLNVALNFGIPQALFYKLPKVKGRRRAEMLKAGLLYLLFYPLLIAGILFLTMPHLPPIAAPFILLFFLPNQLMVILHALKKYMAKIKATLGYALPKVILIAALIYLGWKSLDSILVAILFPGLLASLYAGEHLLKEIEGARLRLSLLKDLAKVGIPLIVFSSFIVVLGWMDTFALGMLKGSVAVAVYNAIMVLERNINFVIIPGIAVSLVPVLGALKGRGKRRAYEKVISISLFLSFLFAAYFVVNGKAILFVLYPSFLNSLHLFQLTFLLLSLLPLAHVLGTMASIEERKKLLLLASLLGAFANILLNFLLIPSFGIVGAVVATALSGLLVMVIFSAKLGVFVEKEKVLRYVALFLFLLLPTPFVNTISMPPTFIEKLVILAALSFVYAAISLIGSFIFLTEEDKRIVVKGILSVGGILREKIVNKP